MKASIEGPLLGQAADCEPILHSLPQWFGIESALKQYVKDVDVMPTFVARRIEQIVGFLTIRRHNSFSAEIQVIAVLPDHHRQGVGREMLAQTEEWLKSDGVEYLQVKTLGSSRPDSNYEKTRQFYEALAFRPLEEFETLWGEGLPCLQMVKNLSRCVNLIRSH